MKIVNDEGQLKIGDNITIVGKSISDDQITTVKRVLSVNGKEEIIIDVFHNKYFITDMVLNGSSWVKQVQINN